ncbi:MAG: hypothetical protein AB8G14_11775 [Ilumatobacter sp.]
MTDTVNGEATTAELNSEGAFEIELQVEGDVEIELRIDNLDDVGGVRCTTGGIAIGAPIVSGTQSAKISGSIGPELLS